MNKAKSHGNTMTAATTIAAGTAKIQYRRA
jgi:hypothetical protein